MGLSCDVSCLHKNVRIIEAPAERECFYEAVIKDHAMLNKYVRQCFLVVRCVPAAIVGPSTGESSGELVDMQVNQVPLCVELQPCLKLPLLIFITLESARSIPAAVEHAIHAWREEQFGANTFLSEGAEFAAMFWWNEHHQCFNAEKMACRRCDEQRVFAVNIERAAILCREECRKQGKIVGRTPKAWD